MSARQNVDAGYGPKDRSLANTMRTLRKCLRKWQEFPEPDDDLLQRMSRAVEERYNNGTDKRARYRPKSPLHDPYVTKISTEQRRKLQELQQNATA